MFKAVDPKSPAFKAEANAELAKLNDEIINPPEETTEKEELKPKSNEKEKNGKEVSKEIKKDEK